ncbi:ATP-binding protein [Limnofasciculus baicalensis]|uniref:ATP-binding protein n=1 Tax=Limnofasciculus baicalensis BBK-W-15 TaxID=2699891 RepID=A0AAE3KNK1_9CYAN|nr:ATP-binding protein [Limnofasciculus baicalensis]MCP2728743.1 ATP-binding protein [Limnofasciculus baicalensis BBK-W-15]
MTSINEIIKREVNPFDLINLKPGNFWAEKQESTLTVDSIHQEVVVEVEGILDLVANDNRSRTLLLLGDSGSGKSHLLGRIKRTFNSKAFFAYISPWADSDYIWRHTLRYTVDSLMQTPEGAEESQLMLWLKGLSAFTKRSIKQRIFDDHVWQLLQSDRKKFIKHLKTTYQTERIYNSDRFFGVLHDLADPELYLSACEWLRGDDLSDESMADINVKHSIDSEDAAKNILANFGKISTATHPIVLCFDQLDNIPKLPDGFQDFQSLFNVNTTIHNDGLKNFLIVISLITDTWRRNRDRIQQADKVRSERAIQLKRITLDQASALWAYRLQPLHSQANPQPDSPIFPLTRQLLEEEFPGGKTLPRYALNLGKQEYHNYKNKLLINITPPPTKDEKTVVGDKNPVEVGKKLTGAAETRVAAEEKLAEFKLLWQDEYKKNQSKITKITILSAPEIVRMLQESLAALEITDIKPKLLSGNSASYSLSYQHNGKQIGIVWTEDANMRSFCSVMNACQKAVEENTSITLFLIRAAGVGQPKLEGNKIYRKVFNNSQHHHIKPNLLSVHYLATYHSLVNSALASELVVAGKTVNLEQLQSLIRESKILHNCNLLQELGIVYEKPKDRENDKSEALNKEVKDFLLNLITTQGLLSKTILIQNSIHQYPQINQSQVENLIQQLCESKQVSIINPNEPPEEHLVCLIPQG